MIARVTLEISVGKEFDYLVPEALEGDVRIGSRVRIPLGKRRVMGVVTGLPREASVSALREIEGVVGRTNQITARVLDLARWMAGYYCCPVEAALKCVLPDAVRKEREKWRKRLHVKVLAEPDPFPSLTPRQREIWEWMRKRSDVPMQRILRHLSTTADTVRKLEKLGLVQVIHEIHERDPYAEETILPSGKLDLNPGQKEALDRILAACESGESRVFLLHGVTGSGKTEVYLQAIDHCLSRGRGAIVLVPEISLTPQTVERFKARFGTGANQTLVAVLHSHLSAGERHDEWHKIREGRARIAIGARSAVFAPVDPLGLILVDEEHEHSYKQEDTPRYHARDLSVMRASKEGAVVVLGSATPSMESYHHARSGKYTLLSLAKRADAKTLPIVRIVDMRTEARGEKGIPILSRKLKDAIHKRLREREQVMLFLNRRGYASSLQCPLCGHVQGCPNCSISLTFHRSENRLLCHICGHREGSPDRCPNPECRSREIRLAGIGTQRVEEILIKLFSKARIRRMDSDTLRRKEDYRIYLNEFRTGKTDILLGTQMIAKGLHFPNVTLVGIVYADVSLHIPDFRAGERTFQLLTQVAGRAGRGDVEGEVIVQAFTPFHPAIQHARKHDYAGFYQQEIEFREEFSYPPACRLCVLTLRGKDEQQTSRLAEQLHSEIESKLADFSDLTISGPAPAVLLKAETYFRYQILLRTNRMGALGRRLAPLVRGFKLPEGLRIVIDVDPANL